MSLTWLILALAHRIAFLLSTIYRWVNWSTERWSNLPEAVIGGAGVEIPPSGIRVHTFNLALCCQQELGQKQWKADETEKPDMEVEDRIWGPKRLASTPFLQAAFGWGWHECIHLSRILSAPRILSTKNMPSYGIPQGRYTLFSVARIIVLLAFVCWILLICHVFA